MADYTDFSLPGYRYSYNNPMNDADDDCYQIQDDYDPPSHTAAPPQQFHDLLGFEEDPQDDYSSKKTVEPVKPPQAKTIDEVPVKGAGKTFEQLVEEQMRKDSTAPAQRKVAPKKEFLRKNSGAKPKIQEDKPMITEEPVEEQPQYEDQSTSNRPKQNFLKRGEGKICVKPTNSAQEPAAKPAATVKPQSIPPPQAKPTSTLKSTPAPQAKQPQIASKQPGKSLQPTKKDPPPPAFDDEIQICRDELISEVPLIKPRLKEKPSVVDSPREDSNLDDKLTKLTREIDHLRAKNREDKEKIGKTERQISDLDEELIEISEKRSRKVSELDQWKEEEIRKIRIERRNLEAKLQPVAKRGDPEELEELRSAISRLQDEMTQQESKRKNTLESIKSELIALNTENRMLETELKELEKRRVNEGWTKRKPGATDTRSKVRNGQYY